MRIAIGRAYNGLHKIYKRELDALGVASFYFDIDRPNWLKTEAKQPNAYLWHADDKGENCAYLYKRVYFIEKILGKPVLPDMRMYFAQGDKIKQWQVLNYLKINTPLTYVTENKARAEKIIQRLKYPCVFKNPYGYGGYQLIKVNNLKEAQNYVKQIFNQQLKDRRDKIWPAVLFAQEFIQTERDLRVVTLGNKIFCAYWRQGLNNNWQHNLEQGAQVDYNNIPRAALKLCQQISQRLKFHWMAYDLFVLPNKPIMVNEYSCNFGDKGIRQAGLNIRRAQMAYLKKYLSKKL